ncbi:MAG: alpha/beta fold hydrolase [Burkholderiales bacterium]|nr:alpha/beta fold hydrolase [Burkholderiales bacterium]
MLNYKILSALLVSIFMSNAYATNDIISNEYYIPYKNQMIHLKEKQSSTNKNGKVIVLINSLSIPSLSAFDVPNYSLMDSLVTRGYNVWGIDFIGEGTSSYPDSMESSPAPIGKYPLDATEAVKELNAGVAYILKNTDKDKLSIIGWSWGSAVGAMYAIQNPKKVDRLVLYGAMYSSHLQESIVPIFVKPFAGVKNNFSESLPAYQNIPWQIINTHWNMMLNGNESILDESAVEEVAKVYKTADPKPVLSNSLRRPMGPMKDLYSIWNGKPIYDISKLKTPTLVIYGDQDLFADHNLYNKLTKVKIKKQIELKEATHWLIYEKTRDQFVDNVNDFLNNE